MKHFIAFAFLVALAGCGRGETQTGLTSISGVMPSLSFQLTRANDGAGVTAEDYRGKGVALYCGYTHCPDDCPTTRANFASVLRELGPKANNVRVLFVTVDPSRDTAPILKAYVNTFAPQIDGLRGSNDEIARLTRRFRVLYRVTRASDGGTAEVMHSASIFFFDREGRARLVGTSSDTAAIRKPLAALIQG
jgi:protein SCO1/2